MRNHGRMVPVFLLLSMCAPGCRSQQLANDQDHIRNAVLELHTNQIMDNLIRVRKGLPIIQLDYQHMTGTITQTANAGVNGSQTTNTTRSNTFLGNPAKSFPIFSRMFSNFFAYNVSGSQVNQLTVNAEPVLTNPEVYDAYLDFLRVKEHLIESVDPPSPEEALLVRTREKGGCGSRCSRRKHHHEVYYWVPCIYKDDFFKMALYSVALRGSPVPISPNFEVTIKGIVILKAPRSLDPSKERQVYTIKMKIDKRIPNDRGYMIATVQSILINGNSVFAVEVNPSVESAEANNLTDKQKTDEIIVTFNVGTVQQQIRAERLGGGDVIRDLYGQKVGIHLENFAPSGTRTESLLEDIRYQLELNRLGQFQLAPR